MGYTHYWYYNREFTLGEWQSISSSFQKLVRSLADVPLANVNGSGAPTVTENYLAFNGRAPQSGEPFELFRTREAWAERIGNTNGRKWWGFCKTEHQPYDLAVMTLLLLVSEVVPGALNVESDVKIDGPEWGKAREVLKKIN